MNKRPFRFGVAAEGAATCNEWKEKAREIEDLGYNTFLVPDHFETRFSPIVALLSVAEATSKLRIGSFVFDNDFRHPVLLAKDVATLDLLSEGRFDLGIGAGWLRDEYEQAGIPFDPPGIRLGRLEESLHIIKALFADELVTYTGKYYTIKNLYGLPKPVQHPHPPIFMGGGGKRMLTMAAREADIIGVHFKVGSDGKVAPDEKTFGALREKVNWIQQAAGERFDQLELNILISRVIITDHPERAAGEIALLSTWKNMSVEQILDTPYMLIGSIEQITERIQLLRERCNISYVVIFDEYQHALAPVVAQLAGK